MMRVLHVAPSCARREGGPSEVLRGLLPKLSARGVDWRLVTTDKGATEADADLLSDPRVTAVASRFLPSWTFSSRLLKPLVKEIEESDVVHIHSVHTFPSSLAMALARRLGKPYLLEPHGALDAYHLAQGSLKKRLYSTVIDRRSIRHLSGAIYSSTAELEQGIQFLPHTRPYLMSLGVAEELFDAEMNSTREPATILFLGRITEKKHLDLVLEAMAMPSLQSMDVQLIVAGPEDPRLPYDPREKARNLGIESNVSFLGQVDARDRERLLSSVTAFVLPSEDESFGMAVAEALAAGCPVVSSDRVGIASAAAKAGALTLMALTPEDIASRLEGVLSDHDGRRRMAELGRAYASTKFTWEVAAEQIGAVYRLIAPTMKMAG